MVTFLASIPVAFLAWAIVLVLFGTLSEYNDKVESGESYTKAEVWKDSLTQIFLRKEGWVFLVIGTIVTIIMFWFIHWVTKAVVFLGYSFTW